MVCLRGRTPPFLQTGTIFSSMEARPYDKLFFNRKFDEGVNMDKRFTKDHGREPFTGNELLLKGALEGGVGLITGYPGSPVSDVFDTISRASDLLTEEGIVAQIANNEALSAARLNGARMADLRAMSIMKSVGMHVAADGLAIGNLAEPRKPKGGALVVVGDDPWNETTQINSDSRFLSMHLNMPVIEPSTFQEIKDWIKDSFELSGLSDLYLTYVITTNQADGGGSVQCRPNIYPAVNKHQKTFLSSAHISVKDMVMIPPHTSFCEATLQARMARVIEGARQRQLNQIHWPQTKTQPSVGFVTAGLSFCYLSQALQEMELENEFPVLKYGMTYPLDEKILLEFVQQVTHLYVIEEKRDFLESQVGRVLQRALQEGRISKMPAIWGKKFPNDYPGIPSVRGINASVLVERLAPLIQKGVIPCSRKDIRRLKASYQAVVGTADYQVNIPLRTPTFCPGCPHRDSSVVTKAIKNDFINTDYMKKKHNRAPIDVIFHGESGCHSMLQFEPNIGLMQNYSGMGLGGGTGAGIDPFVQNKQVVFLGDSTFFHSGMVAISDSIKNRQDITYIILENGTTAMTGHQPTPGSDKNVVFEDTFAQSIEFLVRGMAKDSVPIFRVNPAYRNSYRSLIEDVILKEGVKIIIADKECGITYHRRVRREKKKIIREKGFLPEEKIINVTPEVCEFCLECTNDTGCPGLSREGTHHGSKIITDKSLCVADGACTNGKFCPSFEELVIRRTQAPAVLPEFQGEQLPMPAPASFDDVWYCYTAGVGGMGSGVTTAILVQAGILQGYHVLFADKKGLAIRNGGVYGHVIYSQKEHISSPIIPYGMADLLLGIDCLEAVRGLDPKVNLRVAGAARTTAVVNMHKMPTIRTLLGKDDFDVSGLVNLLKKYTKPDRFLGMDFSNISEEYFGSKLYCNVLLLGAAFQRGLIPVSWDNLTRAVRMMVPPAEREENLSAVQLGRHVAAHPDRFVRFSMHLPGYWEVLQDKTDLLKTTKFLGKRLAREYRKMVEDAVRWMEFEEPLRAKLALYVYDLIQFEGLRYAQRYLRSLWSVYKKDQKERGFMATKAVLVNLYRALIIKDEVYVAHLLTAPEKFRRDNERFRIDKKRGDKTEYVHLTRPQFKILGRAVEFDLKSRDWQLRIMKNLRFLRKIWPEWHAPEKAFRAWYENVVSGFNIFADNELYDMYVKLFELPATIKGYRNIRYPKIEAAVSAGEELIKKINIRRSKSKFETRSPK